MNQPIQIEKATQTGCGTRDIRRARPTRGRGAAIHQKLPSISVQSVGSAHFLTRPHPTTSWEESALPPKEVGNVDHLFMGLGVVVMAVLVFSVLTIMKKEGEAQEAAN